MCGEVKEKAKIR
uniref:Uncharacterized protein n=1 Tax=Rhizophora mucronata TaxID=61149 RepID=A0A2P2NPC6_RHIMU